MITDLLPGEIIVDNFAGGGGASVGIEMALGRSPDEAANHDQVALAIHKANHPHTRHHKRSFWPGVRLWDSISNYGYLPAHAGTKRAFALPRVPRSI